MWNPLKKDKEPETISDGAQGVDLAGQGMPKMGMLQRLAMKRFMNMNDGERAEMMQKFLTPENIAKNRGKISEAMDAMIASGMMTKEQAEMAKRQLGL